jgi:hypothetical protein
MHNQVYRGGDGGHKTSGHDQKQGAENIEKKS